ncbi:MAG: GNAT family N-acetyltransferase [Pseudorhodobacter sp.]
MIFWRPARAEDVPAVVALLRDDELGMGREAEDLTPYLAAFEAMKAEGGNHLIVGEHRGEGRVVATYQLTFITGLSLRASRRAQVESVRVDSGLRGQGLGARLMADAEKRAKAAGCSLIQLTTNAGRGRAHDFYARLGYQPSHIGFKKPLR